MYSKESKVMRRGTREYFVYLLVALGIAALLIMGLCSCSEQKTSEGSTSSAAATTTGSSTANASDRVSIESDASVMDSYDWTFSDRDLDPSYDATQATKITLSDSGVNVEGSGASATGSVVAITEEGTYILEGTLSDGSIIVDFPDENTKAQLVLAGVDITCSNGAAILVENADKVFITLDEGTSNTLADGSTHDVASDGNDHDGVIFSHDDLTLNGSGTLTINAHYDNGIVGKNDVRVTGGIYNITARGHGVQGKDCIKTLDGTFVIDCGADGFHASNDEDETLGYLGIGGGNYTIDSDDDAFHADSALLIADGVIDIKSSYEGFEGKTVSITGATTSVVSDDDGINAASGSELNDNQGFMGPGGENATASGSASESECFVEITGGTHWVSAAGDCLDSNGTLTISGGETIVECRATGGDGAVDSDGEAKITGGVFMSVGPSDMAQAFSSSSTQVSVFLNASTANAAGQALSVVDANGIEICSFTLEVSNRSFLFSSPDLVEGDTYTIVSGGQEIGSVTAELSSQAGFNGAPDGGQPGGQQPGGPMPGR